MNLFPKEYRAIVGASAFAILSVGASATFLWQAHERHATALEEMLKRNKEFDGLRAGTPAPTEESRKQIEERKKTAITSVNKLRDALTAMNIPLEKIQPQEFQTALNTKTQNFIAKATKSRISIPRGAGESDPFFMDFDEFIKRVPSEDKVSAVNRQLTAADHLLNSLLDSKPLSLISFKIDRSEDTKELKEAKDLKLDSKSGKGGPQTQPQAPVLSALGFDLKFTASPDSFRDFLNALTRDKHAFFVVRRVKITTLSKDGVPMPAPSKTPVTTPAEPATPGQPQATPVAQYILGDEHVEVEMRVDLLTALPPPSAAPTTGEKSAKPPTKEGAKQP
jgi:hypothetical protein